MLGGWSGLLTTTGHFGPIGVGRLAYSAHRVIWRRETTSVQAGALVSISTRHLLLTTHTHAHTLQTAKHTREAHWVYD